MSSVGALHLKTSLLYYYRFKRNYLCTDECYSNFHEKADILVDTGKNVYEIEIKVNRADLNKEKHKKKHKDYIEGQWGFREKTQGANKFYICVPTKLLPHAEKWINEINPKYGLIEFKSDYYEELKTRWAFIKWDKCLGFRKKASNLHTNYNKNIRNRIIKRLPSALCNAYINILEGIDRRERDK